MGWGAEQAAFAVAGALLLLCGAIAGNPRTRVSRPGMVATIAAAVAFIAAAFLSRDDDGVALSPWAWLSVPAPALLLTIWGARMLASTRPSNRVLACVGSGGVDHRRAASAAAGAQSASTSRHRKASDPATSGTELADLAYAHPDLRVAIASNPSTPANVLGWLATSGSDDVVEAIAQRSAHGPNRTDDDPRE